MSFHPFDHVGRIECAIGLNDGVKVIGHDLRRNAAGGLFAGFCKEGEDEKHKEGDSEGVFLSAIYSWHTSFDENIMSDLFLSSSF